MSSFINNARLLPRTFWVLAWATFVNRFGLFVWPFLTLFITSQGNTAAQAGIAVSRYSIGAFLAAWLGGWLADRLGRNVTMALSAFSGSLCMLLLSQASDWRLLAALALITGLTTESGQSAGNALVQDLVPPELRVTAFSALRFCINAGWSLGPMTAGLLAKHSFFWLFVVDAVTSFFFAFICLLYLPRGRRSEAHLAGWGVAWQSIRLNGPFLAMCCASVLNAWVWRMTNTAFPLHFGTSHLPLDWCGYVLALNGVMIITLEPFFASATVRWPVRFMLATGYVMMGSSFLPLLFANGIEAFVLCMIIFTVGEMFAFSRQHAYVASLSPEDMRGRYSGFHSFAWSLGGIVSSVGGLSLYELSHNAVWLISAGYGLLAAVIIATCGRQSA